MKESVLDVLIYLFDHYIEQEFMLIPNQTDLKSQLNQAGFADIQIDKAIDWLEGLAIKKMNLMKALFAQNLQECLVILKIKNLMLNVKVF